MIKNRLKTLWAEGTPTLNGWLSIPSGFVAEVMAAQGYDSMTIDMQHGLIDYTESVAMLQAMRASDVVPIVRVPWLDPAAIMKALDAGAYGIICPMVNTREQAEALVSYVRYPPKGNRSFGPVRAMFSAGDGYAAEANDEVICLAMIETAEAMSNLDEIVATPGLDGVYIGPADLTLGLANGRLAPGFDRQEPEMIEAIQKIQAAADQAGIRACLHCGSPEYAKRGADWGFNMLTLLNDTRMLVAAANDHVTRTRGLLG
ncbi:MAG: 2,4-dihydroxyhept-2-ene-1,7-dioic acid aldolase [Gammaproteobacteria bacterium]|nr:2,4-dihydroxyhept-2-ene-1,7-dioic acid aldolase [Gammaproteobacteria bacterium]